MKGFRLHMALLLLGLAFFCVDASAQFKSDAFSQSYNDDKASDADSVDVLFSFKEYFGALGHKNEMKIGNSFAGSTVFIGGQQIYNKQYWKLPLIYGSMAAGVGGGIYFNSVYNRSLQGDVNEQAKTISTLCFVAAGVSYWGTLMDGVVNYKPDDYPKPGKATLYSILLPGLGQIYNGEMWKLPFYWGGLVGAFHFYNLNNRNYERFRMVYNRANDPDYTENVPISSSTALYYRDVYRRYRDYSMLAILGFYLLQVIDANVFAYMHNFDVTDDFAMSVSPTLITPENQYATVPSSSALGLRLGLTF